MNNESNISNKTTLIILAVVLVIASLFLFKSKDKKAENLSDTNTASSSQETVKIVTTTKPKPATTVSIQGMKTSLGGIFDEKGNYQCDYEQVSSQSRSSNVLYFSDGKMRGEFRTIAVPNSTSVLMVYDGFYLYVWTEGMSTGTRTQPKTIADLPGIIPEDITSGRILGSSTNNVSWNCHAWSKVPSMLAKPSYVKFN